MAAPPLPDWRQKILGGVQAPVTPANLKFLDLWARAEGGTAANNPFNTTQSSRGATPYNTLDSGGHVWNYVSPQAGLQATIQTLNNGRYGNIISALQQGSSAKSSADALAASPWGTGSLVQKMLGSGEPYDPTETANAVKAYSDPITKTAQNLKTLQQTYGSWDKVLDHVSRGAENEPALNYVGNLFQQSAPSDHTAKILDALGGIAGKAAKAGQDPIPLPAMMLGQLNGPRGPIKVKVDHQEPIAGNTGAIVQAAEKFLGTPYLWGGADPRKGFDCSGFVQYLYQQEGIKLPRTTYTQVKAGTPVKDPKALKPGDIVFFSSKGDVHHEGLFIGDGQFIHAPHTGDVVRISSLNEPYYKSQFLTGRRIIDAEGGGV